MIFVERNVAEIFITYVFVGPAGASGSAHPDPLKSIPGTKHGEQYIPKKQMKFYQ
jgi:hypothetical protein